MKVLGIEIHFYFNRHVESNFKLNSEYKKKLKELIQENIKYYTLKETILDRKGISFYKKQSKKRSYGMFLENKIFSKYHQKFPEIHMFHN